MWFVVAVLSRNTFCPALRTDTDRSSCFESCPHAHLRWRPSLLSPTNKVPKASCLSGGRRFRGWAWGPHRPLWQSWIWTPHRLLRASPTLHSTAALCSAPSDHTDLENCTSTKVTPASNPLMALRIKFQLLILLESQQVLSPGALRPHLRNPLALATGSLSMPPPQDTQGPLHCPFLLCDCSSPSFPQGCLHLLLQVSTQILLPKEPFSECLPEVAFPSESRLSLLCFLLGTHRLRLPQGQGSDSIACVMLAAVETVAATMPGSNPTGSTKLWLPWQLPGGAGKYSPELHSSQLHGGWGGTSKNISCSFCPVSGLF